jgi:hypothetical protein
VEKVERIENQELEEVESSIFAPLFLKVDKVDKYI